MAARRALGTSMEEIILRPSPFYFVESKGHPVLVTLDLSCNRAPMLIPKVLDVFTKNRLIHSC